MPIEQTIEPKRNQIKDTVIPAVFCYSTAAIFMGIDESTGAGIAALTTGGLLWSYARNQSLPKSVGEIGISLCAGMTAVAVASKLGM